MPKFTVLMYLSFRIFFFPLPILTEYITFPPFVLPPLCSPPPVQYDFFSMPDPMTGSHILVELSLAQSQPVLLKPQYVSIHLD